MSAFRIRVPQSGTREDVRMTPPSLPEERTAANRLPSGTRQQEELWSELASPSERHVLVEARAGSGKSSSCAEGMHRQVERDPGLRGLVRYSVFSSQNAKEFRSQCPDGVEVGTVHSFGYGALQKSLSSKFEKNKTYLILDESRDGKAMPRYYRKSVAMLVGAAKNQGLLPGQEDIHDTLIRLLLHYDINCYGRPGWLAEWGEKVLRRAAEWTELVDFDDMIWLPAVHNLDFPHIECLYLDEVQDWNPAQHALIPLLCPRGRVVAVGDRYQAIYAWRGADADSIPNLESRLGQDATRVLARMPLTMTWRCPKSHVALAQHFVGDIESRPDARDGTIGHLGLEEALEESEPGDMVLSPTNAPLISGALQLIAQRRRSVVRGRAVGDQLVSILRTIRDARTVNDLYRGVKSWESRELIKLSDMDGVEDIIESVQDRVSGLLAVLTTCDSPEQVEPAIAQLFSEDADPKRLPSAVIFSTIHRAKGLEADCIRLLRAPTRTPRMDWEIQQAKNLQYVALTRSKDRLVFVTMPE